MLLVLSSVKFGIKPQDAIGPMLKDLFGFGVDLGKQGCERWGGQTFDEVGITGEQPIPGAYAVAGIHSAALHVAGLCPDAVRLIGGGGFVRAGRLSDSSAIAQAIPSAVGVALSARGAAAEPPAGGRD